MSCKPSSTSFGKHSLGLIGVCLLVIGGLAHAQLDALLGKRQDQDFLPVEQAFQLRAAALDATRIQLSWIIAPGYYLYRDRLKFAVEGTDPALGAISLPSGTDHTDEYFGRQVVYYNSLVVELPLIRRTETPLPVTLKTTYQGCADAGLCYPPQTTLLMLQLPASGSPPDTLPDASRWPWLAASVSLLVIALAGFVIARRRGLIRNRRSGT